MDSTLLNLLESDLGNIAIVIIIAILGSWIKIPKLEINIWGWIGKQFNSSVNDKIDELERKLNQHIEGEEQENAQNRRYRILRFAEDLRNGFQPTEEHFKTILSDIDEYNDYCFDHPKFKNNLATHAIELINEEFDKVYSQLPSDKIE